MASPRSPSRSLAMAVVLAPAAPPSTSMAAQLPTPPQPSFHVLFYPPSPTSAWCKSEDASKDAGGGGDGRRRHLENVQGDCGDNDWTLAPEITHTMSWSDEPQVSTLKNMGGGCSNNSWKLAPQITPYKSWDDWAQDSSPEKKCLRAKSAGPTLTSHEWVSFQGKILSMMVTCDAEVAVSFLEEI